MTTHGLLAEFRGLGVRRTHVTRRTRRTPPKSAISENTKNIIVTHRRCLPIFFLSNSRLSLTQKFFWHKIFSDENFFSDPKNFFVKIFFQTKNFFRSKIIFRPKFLFGHKILSNPKKISDPKFFLTQNELQWKRSFEGENRASVLEDFETGKGKGFT